MRTLSIRSILLVLCWAFSRIAVHWWCVDSAFLWLHSKVETRSNCSLCCVLKLLNASFANAESMLIASCLVRLMEIIGSIGGLSGSGVLLDDRVVSIESPASQ
jgi:hypothetical protein